MLGDMIEGCGWRGLAANDVYAFLVIEFLIPIK